MIFSEGAQVADKAVQEVLSRVDALAAKLGIAAQHVWEIYVQQAKVEAIRDVITTVLFLLIAFGLFKAIPFFWGLKQKAASVDRYEDGAGWAAAAIISGVLILPAVGLVLGFLYSAVGEWINPQYWAFQHLVLDLKNIF